MWAEAARMQNAVSRAVRFRARSYFCFSAIQSGVKYAEVNSTRKPV